MPRQLASAIFAILFLLCSPFCEHQKTFAAEAPKKAGQNLSVRIMTFNVRYENKIDGPDSWSARRGIVIETIRRFQADFVGLQEPIPSQVAYIEKSFPDYRMLSRTREADPKLGEATPILFRRDRWMLDPEERGWFWLSETPDVPGSIHWRNKRPRTVTWARFIDVKTHRGIYVFNTHLDHESELARRNGVLLIADRIARRHRADPVLLTGDFNAIASSLPMQYLTDRASKFAALVDTFRLAHPDEKVAGTFHGFKGNPDGSRIDYILASPGVIVSATAIVRYNRDGRFPSDHFPVTAELCFPPLAAK